MPLPLRLDQLRYELLDQQLQDAGETRALAILRQERSILNKLPSFGLNVATGGRTTIVGMNMTNV